MTLGGVLGGLTEAAGALVKVAGPAVAGFATGGPVGAGLAVVGQVAGGAEKKRSKRRELRVALEGGGPVRRVHKATAPAAAVAVPAAVAGLASALGLDIQAGGLGVLCPGGEITAAGAGFLAGVLALLAHTLGHGLQDASRAQ